MIKRKLISSDMAGLRVIKANIRNAAEYAKCSAICFPRAIPQAKTADQRLLVPVPFIKKLAIPPASASKPRSANVIIIAAISLDKYIPTRVWPMDMGFRIAPVTKSEAQKKLIAANNAICQKVELDPT
jgi:hypothetical protein